MKKGDVKLFKDAKLLCDMLALRSMGWSTTSLAMLYACDRKAIEKQCKKYGAKPQETIYTVERITMYIIRPLVNNKWKMMGDVRINKGKSYAEYLKVHIPIEKQRKSPII